MQLIWFWAIAALISGGAAFLMLARAAAAERAPRAADPELEVYRRQLAEIDELADRGLLGTDERRAAHAEAGRRLLGHAGRKGAEDSGAAKGWGRMWVLAAAVVAPLLALGGYLLLGSPGFPDQPFRQRLKQWDAAYLDSLQSGQPSNLNPAQVTAVLTPLAAQHPDNWLLWWQLGSADFDGDDLAQALQHLQKATALAPADPSAAERAEAAGAWTLLGATRVRLADGQINPDAAADFDRARALDPSSVDPRYFVGVAMIDQRRLPDALAAWQAVLAGMAPDDPRRPRLQTQITELAAAARPAAQAPSGGADQAAFIQSMVDGLAARLKAQPDDPQGWARLIRAYGVLGQTQRRDAAVAEARRLFKDRPDALRTALAGAPSPPGP